VHPTLKRCSPVRGGGQCLKNYECLRLTSDDSFFRAKPPSTKFNIALRSDETIPLCAITHDLGASGETTT